VLRFFAALSSPRKLFCVVVQQSANIFARLQPRLIERREPARQRENLGAKKPAAYDRHSDRGRARRRADPCSRAARNRNIQREADMTPRIPENPSTSLADWSLVTLLGDTPPRDDDAAEDDGNDEDDDDPAVIREPDEDE
jgi:hypothetical protein